VTDRDPADIAADAALIEAFRDGDLGAFEVFYRRHEGAVYRTAVALTRDPMSAEEVVTDTFLRAYAARGRLDPARSPIPWLQRVAINLSVSHLRRNRGRVSTLDELEGAASGDRAASPEWCVEQDELNRILVRGIAALPPHQRAVVILRFVHDNSLAEIASLVDRPLGTVKSRLHHALARLRDECAADLLADRRQPEPGMVPRAVRAAVDPEQGALP
jgi:RNA polymerase sigma-70 factor (ECF subfamily)